MSPMSKRPEAGEYFDYYDTYVRLVPDGEIVSILKNQLDEQLAWYQGFSADKWDHRYAEGKWSVKQVLGHVLDAEWVFSYRALRFARGDETPLPGMEQDDFMAGANFDDRDPASLMAEWKSLRTADTELFSSFDEDILNRRGQASGCEFTVRALAYIIAGHAYHHRGVIESKYDQ